MRDRRWNSECFIVFQTVTPQKDRHVTSSQDICRRIEKCLDAWEAGHHAMPVEDRAKTYYSLVLHGKLWTAVRWITEREKGGVLLPEDKCTKTGERVVEVLRTKHLDARPHSAARLDAYPNNLP